MNNIFIIWTSGQDDECWRKYQNGVWLINTVILWFDTQLIQTISNKIQWLQRSIHTEATNCMNIKMVPLKLSCGSNFRLSASFFFHFNIFLIRHTSKSRAQFTNCTYIYYMSFLLSFETLLIARHVLISSQLQLQTCFLLPMGVSGADPGFFLGGGALISCSTSTPINHIVFFCCTIPVVLENCRSSRGEGGAHPLHPPPRSAPVSA